MPKEVILQMRLTSHMVYDCAPADDKTGVYSENPDLPAVFSFEPAEHDQLESDTEEIDEPESDGSSLGD